MNFVYGQFELEHEHIYFNLAEMLERDTKG